MCDVTKDQILDGSITILQPKSGYRAAIDPIILSASVKLEDNDKVLDMGCGVGTISLILAKKYSDISITGIDIQEELIDLANKNIELNQSDSVEFKTSDISNKEELPENCYDVVVSNPPYMDSNKYSPSTSNIKNTANSEENADLKAWINSAHHSLKNAGKLFMIHRTDRLDDIIKLSHNKFGNFIILPIFPKKNKPSNRIIIFARKGKKDPLQILPGIILHEDDGKYTQKAKNVLYNLDTINLWSK